MSFQNLHPVFKKMLGRGAKERLLKQHALVVWLYGLSGSGKTTIAVALEKQLYQEGYMTQVLDGDNVRSGINSGLGFSQQEREENIRRTAEVSKLFVNAGVITFASFITPLKEHRQKVIDIVGRENVLLVYVKASFETCKERDVKGLYAKAARGEIENFTGKDSTFEEPEDAMTLVLDTENESLDDSVRKLHAELLPRIKFRG